MKENKKDIINLIGQEKYAEEVEILEEIKAENEKKGTFLAIAGDVDERPA